MTYQERSVNDFDEEKEAFWGNSGSYSKGTHLFAKSAVYRGVCYSAASP